MNLDICSVLWFLLFNNITCNIIMTVNNKNNVQSVILELPLHFFIKNIYILRKINLGNNKSASAKRQEKRF